jgi:hypothetical protein
LAAPPPIPERLQVIDELIVFQHHHVGLDDECFFLWERPSGRYDVSATNQLISNIQIPPNCGNNYRLYYKTNAIIYAAGALGKLVPGDWKKGSTFVPIPPSAVETDPGYDNRLARILGNANAGLSDVRTLVRQKQNTVAKQKQVSPEERAENYEINEAKAEPEPNHIVIFDDVLAGGSHFKGMKLVLQDRFPGVPISGLFLARAIHPQTDFDFSDLLNCVEPE